MRAEVDPAERHENPTATMRCGHRLHRGLPTQCRIGRAGHSCPATHECARERPRPANHADLVLPRNRHQGPPRGRRPGAAPHSPRPVRARRNDLDTDERRATIHGEEGPPVYPPRRDALSGSRHIVYCLEHVLCLAPRQIGHKAWRSGRSSGRMPRPACFAQLTMTSTLRPGAKGARSLCS